MNANSQTERSRWLALIVLCLGVLMIVLDATIVNVALPDIQDDLGFSQSSLAWVVNAYLIAFGGLLLLAGRVGDLTSRRGDVRRRARNDRDDVPRAARAGQGDRGVRVRGLGGRLRRPHRRRCAHPG